ncbi:Uncharacterised protein [Vibrio mimicus]|nr:hypothetical protein [Vibrio mimicus]EMB48627.1 hypothetical protein D908_18146 [Vibrio mimicus CAIM 602]SUQ23412.1 Uncharacterised protein [Vibrio mimicus]
MVVVFEFSVMRCQPLRRALNANRKLYNDGIMEYFTYITGVATLIGFGMQLFDFLPSFRAYRQSAFLVFLGMFIGSLFNTIDGSQVQLSFEISALSLLVCAIGAVIVWCLYVAKKERREEFFGVAGLATFVLFMILMFGGLSGLKTEEEKDRLTLTEFIVLSDYAEQKGDFEKAIKHREAVLNKLAKDDVRIESIKGQIKQLKQRQIGI